MWIFERVDRITRELDATPKLRLSPLAPCPYPAPACLTFVSLAFSFTDVKTWRDCEQGRC